MTYTVNSTDTAQAVYYDFSWAVNSAAMKDGAATEVQDAENYAYLVAIKAKTDTIGTNAADSPAAATAQTTIATNLNAMVSSRSTYNGGLADTNAAATLAQATAANSSISSLSTLATGAGFNVSSSSVTGIRSGLATSTQVGSPMQAGAIFNGSNQFIGEFPGTLLENTPTAGGGGGGLSGPSTLTIHYQDSTGTLVPSVEFTLAGASLRANSSGGVATGINDGTYSIVSGMTNLILFPVTAVTVAGNTSVTITGAAAQIPFTPAPGTVVGSMVATDGSGNPQTGIVFNFTLVADANGDLISGSTTSFSATSDSSGNAYAEFVPGWTYYGTRGNGIVGRQNKIKFVAPNANWSLPTMLGE